MVFIGHSKLTLLLIAEINQVQIIDKVVDVPVTKERMVPVIEKVTKTVEVPEVQIIDKIVDVPVTKERMVPMIEKVTKTVEVPQVCGGSNTLAQAPGFQQEHAVTCDLLPLFCHSRLSCVGLSRPLHLCQTSVFSV